MIAGILYYFVIKNFDNFDPRLKAFLFAGFLGGFTTFSAFSLDFFRLTSAGQYSQALLYAFASVAILLFLLRHVNGSQCNLLFINWKSYLPALFILQLVTTKLCTILLHLPDIVVSKYPLTVHS
jgi:hypothetical protein